MARIFQRLKIRQKLILTLLPILLLSLAIMGSLWYLNALNAVHDSVEQQTLVLAQNASLLIEKHLQERKLEVSSIGQQSWVQEFFAKPTGGSAAAHQDRFKRLLVSFDGVYSQITALDKALNPFAKVQLTSFATNNQLPIHFEVEQFDELDKLGVQDPTDAQSAAVSISGVMSIRGSQVLILTTVVNDPQTSKLGFLAFVFPVAGVAQRVIKNYNIGLGGQTFIADQTGRLIHHTSPSKVNQTLQAAMPYLAENRHQILTLRKSIFSYRDDEADSWVLSVASVPSARWIVGVASPLEPFLQSTQRAGVFGVLLTVGISVILLVLIHFLSKRMARNISEVTAAANAVATGELDLKVPVRSEDEIGELARDFNKMAQDLKRLIREVDIHKNLAAIGEFAAAMYHDVKSPLEGLKLLASGLQRKIEIGDPRRAYIDEIAIGIANLDQLIHETLDFVKPKRLNLQSVDLNSFLRSIVFETAVDGLEVDWKLADGLPEIKLDPVQFKHVVLNLISNAKEAVAKDGRLAIATTRNHDSVLVRFVDSGTGIDPENLQNIFQPFYSTKNGGHGLGLAIVHQIVKNHDGEIGIESQLGKGTKVTVRLPVTQES